MAGMDSRGSDDLGAFYETINIEAIKWKNSSKDSLLLL